MVEATGQVSKNGPTKAGPAPVRTNSHIHFSRPQLKSLRPNKLQGKRQPLKDNEDSHRPLHILMHVLKHVLKKSHAAGKAHKTASPPKETAHFLFVACSCEFYDP